MLLVEGDGVCLGGWKGRVGTAGDGVADGYLSGQADDLDGDVRGDEFGNSGVDVVWITREEGAEEDEDFSGCMGGGVI